MEPTSRISAVRRSGRALPNTKIDRIGASRHSGASTAHPRHRPALRAFRYDFRTGYPDIERFPFDIWRRLSGRAARALSQDSAHDEPQGRVSLREAVAKHVSFARAVACNSDDIVIVNGTRDALNLI